MGLSESSEYHFWRVKDTKFNFKRDAIYLSFTKGATGYGRVISAVTRGPYSHVDIVINNKRYSALTKTGVNEYELNPDDLVTIFRLDEKYFDKNKIMNFFKKTKGKHYSYKNALKGQLGFKDPDDDEFFCSQWVSEALDKSYKKDLTIGDQLLKDFGYNRIDPNALFNWLIENKHLTKKERVTNSPYAESVPYMAFYEKYEINRGIYELYGPKEKPFTDKKHIVSLCYRLMWNLKNTNKVREFDEIESIYFDTVKGKPYSMIVTNDGRKFVFYLGYIYTPIPDEFNDKEIKVDPMEHNINVYVNTKGDALQEDISELQTGTGGSNKLGGWMSSKTKKEEPTTEEEALLEDKDKITNEVVEDLVDQNKDVLEDNVENEQEKEKLNVVDKIKETFEDKIINGLIKRGVLKDEEKDEDDE
jgi:hypothetical protein|nr:MAG TPA: Permuted papain-like amidase enzyme, YaeF/YiiX, C92 family [Caudoviricetes sp.]